MPKEKWAALSIVTLCGLLGLLAFLQRYPTSSPSLNTFSTKMNPDIKDSKSDRSISQNLEKAKDPSPLKVSDLEKNPEHPLSEQKREENLEPSPEPNPKPPAPPPPPMPQLPPNVPSPSWAKTKSPNPRMVNPNTASQKDLETLPGIGPKIAQKVIEHRKNNGPFQKAEDLIQVKGIGPKKLEKIRPWLKF